MRAMWLATGMVLATGHGWAQSGNAPPPPPDSVVPDKINPPAGRSNAPQGGVITPPSSVDPGINKGAPDGRAFPTPIVPAPQGGGGAVVPK